MTELEKNIELIKEISGSDPYKCMRCGKCTASCPAYSEMDIKPHQFASYIIRGDFEELIESKAAWKCLSCFVSRDVPETSSPVSSLMLPVKSWQDREAEIISSPKRFRSFLLRIFPSSCSSAHSAGTGGNKCRRSVYLSVTAVPISLRR